ARGEGFTLVEVAFALSVFVIMAVAVADAVTAGMKAHATAHERSLALVAAQAELETLVALARTDAHALTALDQTAFDVAGLAPVDATARHVGGVRVNALAAPLVDVAVDVRWR